MIDVNCEAGGRHEFEPKQNYSWHQFQCIKCKQKWDVDELVPQVNAAMQLTADEAESRVDYNIMGVHTEDERMKEYARRWRGDTEAPIETDEMAGMTQGYPHEDH